MARVRAAFLADADRLAALRWAAAFFAATLRSVDPFVRAAFLAAAERLEALRFEAAWRDCRDNADFEADDVLSRFKALVVARLRLADAFLVAFFAAGRLRLPSFAVLLLFFAALRFLLLLRLSGTSTPARRASDRPMAMACLADRAPCLPWRM